MVDLGTDIILQMFFWFRYLFLLKMVYSPTRISLGGPNLDFVFKDIQTSEMIVVNYE